MRVERVSSRPREAVACQAFDGDFRRGSSNGLFLDFVAADWSRRSAALKAQQPAVLKSMADRSGSGAGPGIVQMIGRFRSAIRRPRTFFRLRVDGRTHPHDGQRLVTQLRHLTRPSIWHHCIGHHCGGSCQFASVPPVAVTSTEPLPGPAHSHDPLRITLLLSSTQNPASVSASFTTFIRLSTSRARRSGGSTRKSTAMAPEGAWRPRRATRTAQGQSRAKINLYGREVCPVLVSSADAGAAQMGPGWLVASRAAPCLRQ